MVPRTILVVRLGEAGCGEDGRGRVVEMEGRRRAQGLEKAACTVDVIHADGMFGQRTSMLSLQLRRVLPSALACPCPFLNRRPPHPKNKEEAGPDTMKTIDSIYSTPGKT